jgi:hypothetical protein
MPHVLRYAQLIHELVKRVPAFATEREINKSYLSHDDDDPYLVFGDFGRFLVNVIRNQAYQMEREKLLTDSFELLSEMATSSDDQVVNVAETTVFEALSDFPETVAAAREYLSERAVPVFERIVDLWPPESI